MKTDAFLVFDVETPNSKHNKICQIGMVHVRPNSDQTELRAFGYLVNPEVAFDERCCAIHGINPSDVLNEPTFKHLWESQLESLFASSIVVAHNAIFDLCVLSKTLCAYGIKVPEINYIDTLDLSRKFYSSLPNHKLPTITSHLGYDICKHHDAVNDALATYHVMDETFKRFGCNAFILKQFNKEAEVEVSTMDTLTSLLNEISSDKRITFDEAFRLAKWVQCNATELPSHLVNELSQTLFDVMKDGQIDSNEEDRLLHLINRILCPTDDCDHIVIKDKVFVLTGDFQHDLKQNVAAAIENCGGKVIGAVSKKVDYVVIGNFGSDRYCNGTYGTKVKKAMELQESGVEIQIISEDDLYKVM